MLKDNTDNDIHAACVTKILARLACHWDRYAMYITGAVVERMLLFFHCFPLACIDAKHPPVYSVKW